MGIWNWLSGQPADWEAEGWASAEERRKALENLQDLEDCENALQCGDTERAEGYLQRLRQGLIDLGIDPDELTH